MSIVNVVDDSIYIPEKSIIDKSVVDFSNNEEGYNDVFVGDNSTLSGANTFSGLYALDINIGEKCSITGSEVFSGGYFQRVKIGSETKISGPKSFDGCNFLIRVEIGDNVEIHKKRNFANCSMTELSFGKRLGLFGKETFYGCDSIEHLVIPDGAFIREYRTFAHCKKLKSVSFGNNCLVYTNGMFLGCENLEAVYFGYNCRVHGINNLKNCNKLHTIKCGANFTTDDEIFSLWINKKPKQYNYVRFEEIPKGTECSIRMEPFDKNSVIVQTTCGHYFNEECLRKWFLEKETCPMCRAAFE